VDIEENVQKDTLVDQDSRIAAFFFWRKDLYLSMFFFKKNIIL
jgi:hypothetical protein